MPTDPCRLCDLPHDGPRYTAGLGEHDWAPGWEPPRKPLPKAVTEEREWTPEMGHPLPPARDIDRECTDSDPCAYCKPTGAGDRLPSGRNRA